MDGAAERAEKETAPGGADPGRSNTRPDGRDWWEELSAASGHEREPEVSGNDVRADVHSTKNRVVYHRENVQRSGRKRGRGCRTGVPDEHHLNRGGPFEKLHPENNGSGVLNGPRANVPSRRAERPSTSDQRSRIDGRGGGVDFEDAVLDSRSFVAFESENLGVVGIDVRNRHDVREYPREQSRRFQVELANEVPLIPLNRRRVRRRRTTENVFAFSTLAHPSGREKTLMKPREFARHVYIEMGSMRTMT